MFTQMVDLFVVDEDLEFNEKTIDSRILVKKKDQFNKF